MDNSLVLSDGDWYSLLLGAVLILVVMDNSLVLDLIRQY